MVFMHFSLRTSSAVPQEDPAGVALGEAIRALRFQRGWTQEELAHRIGITVGHLSKIERGHSNPRFLTVMKIARGLDIPPSDLAGKAEAVLREGELDQRG
jgi:XRE family transcriptional regulator, regulator of sulfur utilization